jgi:enamine deaminase RidA (YjgF/YER057c/UK114 family)
MRLVKSGSFALLTMFALTAAAQTPVKRIVGPPLQKFATAVWAGDSLYVAGQMASPIPDVKGQQAAVYVYGDTKTQTISALKNIEIILKSQGLSMSDVVQMQVFLVGDPAKGGKMDFAGMNEAYSMYFGTAEQPNKPTRVALQVAALAAPWGLVEIQVVAVRSK